MNFKRIKTYLNNLIKYMRCGGVAYINITQCVKENSLKNKVILITGGSSGIGLAIAKKVLECGARVIITGRNETKLQTVLNNICSKNVKGLIWDIADINNLQKRFEEAISLYGKIDIAINNAGIWSPKQWNEINSQDWDDILNVNLKGLYFMCQTEAEYFVKTNDTNKIINITSMDGIFARFHPYNASKFGANGLTKGLAKTLIGKNVIVNAIAPGPVKTELNKDYLQGLGNNEYWPETLNKRFVTKEEIAEMASYLCSDCANSIIGQIISIDGGMTLL